MDEFNDYSKNEKIKVILTYLMAIILPILIVGGYTYYINRQVSYENMIDYKITENTLKINNISEGDTSEASVVVTNKNTKVPFLIRFSFDIDKSLDTNHTNLMKVKNTKIKPLFQKGEYYYVKNTKKTTIQLFDQIEWLKTKKTEDGMKFKVKIEAIPANEAAVKKLWINDKGLTVSEAKKLGYLK